VFVSKLMCLWLRHKRGLLISASAIVMAGLAAVGVILTPITCSPVPAGDLLSARKYPELAAHKHPASRWMPSPARNLLISCLCADQSHWSVPRIVTDTTAPSHSSPGATRQSWMARVLSSPENGLIPQRPPVE